LKRDYKETLTTNDKIICPCNYFGTNCQEKDEVITDGKEVIVKIKEVYLRERKSYNLSSTNFTNY
jgi:hypothetical protein